MFTGMRPSDQVDLLLQLSDMLVKVMVKERERAREEVGRVERERLLVVKRLKDMERELEEVR